MNKYEEFDNNMEQLKRIEDELNKLSASENVSLNKIMQLRNEAATYYKACNEVLKDIQKQPTNEQ